MTDKEPGRMTEEVFYRSEQEWHERRPQPSRNEKDGSRNLPAVLGFAAGLASIFLSFTIVVPIAAIVLSVVGIAQTSPGRVRQERGRVLAWIGLVLGIVFLMAGAVHWA